MTQLPKQIPITAIILDEEIYPRKGIDHRRLGIFEPGFYTVQVAQKHGWTESMVWSLTLEVKEDQKSFKELEWWRKWPRTPVLL